jgi:hypothetical protein
MASSFAVSNQTWQRYFIAHLLLLQIAVGPSRTGWAAFDSHNAPRTKISDRHPSVEKADRRSTTIRHHQPGETVMYLLGAVLMQRPKTLSEEELMRSADIGGLGVRFGIAFAAFATLILSLNLAYHDGNDRPQAIAADRPAQVSAAE